MVATVHRDTCSTLTRTERLLAMGLRMLPLKHGKHRILERLLPRPLGAPSRTVVTPYHGAALHIKIDDLVGWHFAMLRSFDPEITEVLRAAAGTGEQVFWDVGANKGACSYAIAAGLPRCKIVAIEPQAQMAADLLHNLGQISPGRFEHNPVGIGTRDEVLELTIPQGNSGRATLHPERMYVSGRTESVQLLTATSLAEGSRFGWPSLVKIDVEGHESEVVSSLAPCLESNRCRAMVFENHASDKDGFSAIYAQASRNGYRVFGIAKTPFSTRLIETREQVQGVTDYVLASAPLLAEAGEFTSMIRQPVR